LGRRVLVGNTPSSPIHLAYILLDKLAKCVPHIVEEMTIRLDTITILSYISIILCWLVLTAVVTTASLVLGVAITRVTIAVIILVITLCTGVAEVLSLVIIVVEDGSTTITRLLKVLILPTIGGVEIMVESVLSTIQFAPPIVGVFTYDLVATSATLGIVVVSRDSNYIRRIDLDNHGLASVAVREVREILDGAEVQSIRASAILVLVHLVARHLTDRPYGVVECARVNVLVVRLDILEGEEESILGVGEITHIQEVTEFVDCTKARILHKVAEEVDDRLNREILFDEVDDLASKGVVQRLTLVVHHTIDDRDIGVVDEILYLARQIHLIKEGFPILCLDCIQCLCVVRMRVVNRID
jgi:hypothetical protein